MKAKDLIQLLSVFDPELEVLVPGADGGLCDIGGAHKKRVIFGACSGGWCGPHHEDDFPAAFDPELVAEGAKQGQAVVLRRK